MPWPRAFLPALAAAATRFATPAQAQTAEAVQAGAKAADAIITQGGIYGSIAILVTLFVAVAFVVLGLVIRTLWKTIGERDAMIAELQNRRAEDGKVSAKLLTEVATTGSMTIAANTTAQAELTNRMQKQAEILAPMSGLLERVLSGLDRNASKIEEVRDLASRSRA